MPETPRPVRRIVVAATVAAVVLAGAVTTSMGGATAGARDGNLLTARGPDDLPQFDPPRIVLYAMDAEGNDLGSFVAPFWGVVNVSPTLTLSGAPAVEEQRFSVPRILGEEA